MVGIRRKKIKKRNPYWFFRTTWRYLTVKYSKLRRVREKYKTYYRNEINYYYEARRLDDDVHENFRSRTVETPASFVAVLTNGRVCRQNAFVLTAKYKLLQDVSFEFNAEHLKPIKRQDAYREWKSRPSKYYPKTVAVLIFCSSDNYYHWMFDVLPRIHLLRLSGIRIDKYVLNRQEIFPFQEETLAILGIPNKKIIDSPIDLQARKLVVPSSITRYTLNPHTNVRPDVIPKWACDFLRKEFLLPQDNDRSENNEYIYISRENAKYRKVINEEEIINHLNGFGFKKVTLESMKVTQQVQLFSCAKLIIAPHGAGLTNLVFCKPGTKVIELFNPYYMPSYYWMISNLVHLDYYYLVNEAEQLNSAASDYKVNIGQLLELVHYAGL
ncbi:glycosyltransferase family 61 protein [Paenibacillus tyrfis]|uniref:glycosyltransferase family 61 protein n=1 Tax=Paenibacillus tyrfis TaxID=1501230 RepID=UPI000B5957EF|nr:glycosyltransferase family 61 protein [Paenibacillus tyrfis]